MTYREAAVADIPQIQEVRNSVRENKLSEPSIIQDNDCADYITRRGKGWVCEEHGRITGFAIADLIDHNIWALFVLPDYEHKGIGKKLHHIMLDWYFSQTTVPAWLSTAPNTRAENFYRKTGWVETGTHGSGEIKFEMTYNRWHSISHPGQTFI